MTLPFSAIAAPQRPVWLVLFDPLPVDTIESIDSLPSAFDQLDVLGIAFEQFLVQDLRDAATLDDYLGGVETIRNWCRDARVPERSVIWLQAGSDVQPSGGVFSAPELVASAQARTLQISSAEFLQPPTETAAALASAALVIVSVRLAAATASAAACAELLAGLKSLASTLFTGPQQLQPFWLVTGFRGLPRPLEPPLECGADESSLHVPLWVTAESSAGTRLQVLCGSFDLLPTIGELLSPGYLPPAHTAPPEAPRNLLAEEIQRFDSSPRLLRLQHDHWCGLRTSQYFLVQPIHSEAKPHSNSDSSQHIEFEEPPEPRLYLKPDDYWNISNSIVAFREIADQMASVNSPRHP